jgi:hypothetical protein
MRCKQPSGSPQFKTTGCGEGVPMTYEWGQHGVGRAEGYIVDVRVMRKIMMDRFTSFQKTT